MPGALATPVQYIRMLTRIGQREEPQMSTILDPAVLEALRGFDSPTIANAIETFNLRPRVAGYVGYDVRCIFPDLPPSVGYAVTCTVDSTTEGRKSIGFNHLYALLERAPKPALVV